jgi:hypothetical protein
VALSGGIGLLSAALPWLHFRYTLVALALAAAAVLALQPRLRWRAPERDRYAWAAAALAIGLVVLSLLLVALYSRHYFGAWVPPNSEQAPDWAHPQLEALAPLYGDMFFGPQSGLIPWVPLDLLALPGLVVLWRRWPREGRTVALLLAGLLGIFLTAAVSVISQATALPARFTLECAPLLALCVGALVAACAAELMRMTARSRQAPAQVSGGDGHGRARWRAPLAAAGVGMTCVLLVATAWFAAVGRRDPELLYPSPAGPRVVEAYPKALPSAWFALFPTSPQQWVTQGAVTFVPSGGAVAVRYPRQGPGVAAQSPAVRPGATMASGMALSAPPGIYWASVTLSCAPARGSGVALHLRVTRVTKTGTTTLTNEAVPLSACAPEQQTFQATIAFPSNGYEPASIMVIYGDAARVVVWSATYTRVDGA